MSRRRPRLTADGRRPAARRGDADSSRPPRRRAAGCVVLRLGASRFAVAMADVAEVDRLPGPDPGARRARSGWPASPTGAAGCCPCSTCARCSAAERAPLASQRPPRRPGPRRRGRRRASPRPSRACTTVTLADPAPAPADPAGRRRVAGARPGDRPVRPDRRAGRRGRAGAARAGRPPPARAPGSSRPDRQPCPPSGLQNGARTPDERVTVRAADRSSAVEA